MRALPTDPMGRYYRHFGAFLEDIASPDFLRTGKTPRADAVIAVMRAQDAAAGSLALPDRDEGEAVQPLSASPEPPSEGSLSDD
jgi:hypothetical protein